MVTVHTAGGAADMTGMEERRNETRLLCADLIELDWKNQHGGQESEVAGLDDISETGICVLLDLPLPPGTSVEVDFGGEKLKATSRYCTFGELGYFVGLEFDPGSGWNPDRFLPKHLLDPTTLAGYSAE